MEKKQKVQKLIILDPLVARDIKNRKDYNFSHDVEAWYMKEYLSLASKKSRLASLQHIIKELKSEIEYMEKESLQFVQPNYNCCHICGDFLREDIPGRQTMKISDKIVICKNCYFTSGKAKLLIRQELKKEAENNATKNISS